MISINIYKRLEAIFPFLEYIKDEEKNIILDNGNYYKFKDGQLLMNEDDGNSCKTFILVLNGSIKVSKISEEGREVVLYRIGKGDTCIVNASCILSKTVLSTTAEVEYTSEIVSIPAFYITNNLIKNPNFQEYLCANILMKMEEIVMRFEKVTFRSVNDRVLDFLFSEKHRLQTNNLYITHEKLAYEIGSVREVVSRSLKTLEKQNLIKLDRGKITLLEN